jgi:pterin-4a-carbinolamine dehydratase
MKKLNKSQIKKGIKELQDWQTDYKCIYRTFKTKGFPHTLGLVTAIGAICQQFDHHPDFILVKYSELTVSFSTHSVKGITEKDFQIANELDKLLS